MILTTTFNPDFVTRTLKTTGVVLLFVLAFGSMYYGFYDSLALFSAGVWSMVNLIFLSYLIRAAIRRNRPSHRPGTAAVRAGSDRCKKEAPDGQGNVRIP